MTENNQNNNKNIFVQFFEWCKRSFLHPTTLVQKIAPYLLKVIDVEKINDFELLKKIIISYFLNKKYDKTIDIINKILITNKFKSNDNYMFLYQYLIYSLYGINNKDKAKY